MELEKQIRKIDECHQMALHTNLGCYLAVTNPPVPHTQKIMRVEQPRM